MMPSLKHISLKLGISQSFAGTTFLALGNGFPDLVVAVLGALQYDTPSPGMVVGSVFGACLCCSCLITPVVIEYYSGRLDVRETHLVRDISFYLLGSLTVLVYGLISTVTVLMAGVFILYYLAYILFVFRDEFNRQAEEALLPCRENSFLEEDRPHFRDHPLFQVFVRLVKAVISVTVPAPAPELYNRALIVVQSFCFPSFVILLCNFGNVSRVLFFGLLGLSLALSLHAILLPEQYPRVSLVYSVFGFMASMLWLTLLCNLTLSFFQFIVLISGTNPMLISLSLIALANSLGDYFSVSSIAKGNMPYTCVSGIYGGQLFNLLLGFGCGLMLSCIVAGGQIDFRLWPDSDSFSQALEQSLGLLAIVLAVAHLGSLLL
jgi:Ca2+/Na+ antiporter